MHRQHHSKRDILLVGSQPLAIPDRTSPTPPQQQEEAAPEYILPALPSIPTPSSPPPREAAPPAPPSREPSPPAPLTPCWVF
jgi:hypothetical protein